MFLLRRTLIWWPVLIVPALAVCGWLAIWLQWYLPGGMLRNVGVEFAAVAICGLAVGIGFTATRRRLWIVIAVFAIWPPHLPVSAFLWAWLIIALRCSGLALFGQLGANMARARPGLWRLPLAVALLSIAITVDVGRRLDNRKSFWPWSAHRQELIALRRDAVVAAGRLGLRQSAAPFSDETRRRLSAVVPIETTFELPLIHRRVTARVNETDAPFVWLYFPDGRVAWLEPYSMQISWFGDLSDLTVSR
jgi:hypothetical protein